MLESLVRRGPKDVLGLTWREAASTRPEWILQTLAERPHLIPAIIHSDVEAEARATLAVASQPALPVSDDDLLHFESMDERLSEHDIGRGLVIDPSGEYVRNDDPDDRAEHDDVAAAGADFLVPNIGSRWNTRVTRLHIQAESVNGCAQPPAARVNGRALADLYVFMSVVNRTSRQPLSTKDVTISCAESSGLLLYVDTPFTINGASDVDLEENSVNHLQLHFLVPAALCHRLPSTTLARIKLKDQHWEGPLDFIGEIEPQVNAED